MGSAATSKARTVALGDNAVLSDSVITNRFSPSVASDLKGEVLTTEFVIGHRGENSDWLCSMPDPITL